MYEGENVQLHVHQHINLVRSQFACSSTTTYRNSFGITKLVGGRQCACPSEGKLQQVIVNSKKGGGGGGIKLITKE